jgi:hypothetical protein
MACVVFACFRAQKTNISPGQAPFAGRLRFPSALGRAKSIVGETLNLLSPSDMGPECQTSVSRQCHNTPDARWDEGIRHWIVLAARWRFGDWGTRIGMPLGGLGVKWSQVQILSARPTETRSDQYRSGFSDVLNGQSIRASLPKVAKRRSADAGVR